MMANLGAYPTDLYYDPTRPSWLPYWIDTPSENAQKWGLYPGAPSNSLVIPTPVSPSLRPPDGALDYPPGGSSTSIGLDPVTTVPDYPAIGQQTMDAAASALAADRDAQDASTRRTLLILAGVGVLVFMATRR